MTNNHDTFRFTMPAELLKSTDGESWRISGIASTATPDRQGETIRQEGMNLDAIDKGKGILNFDHGKDITDVVGTLDSYKHTANGLYIEGTLFEKSDKAKAIQKIMSSMHKSGKKIIGLSVEGVVRQRNSKNPKIIEKCDIVATAITLNPVNTETYCDLMKSMSMNSIVFNATGEADSAQAVEPKLFSATEVIELVMKAMSASAAYAEKPAKALTGGDAQAKEELAVEPTNVTLEVKKLKKGDKEFFKAALTTTFDKIKELYPNVPDDTLWKCIQQRLALKFPSVQT